MEFDHPFLPVCHNSSFTRTNDLQFNECEDESRYEDKAFTSPALSRSPSASTIHRYLHDYNHLFHGLNEYQLAQPLPGLIRCSTSMSDTPDGCRRYTSPASSGDSRDLTEPSYSSSHSRSPQLLSLEASNLALPVSEHHDHAISYALGGAGFQSHDDPDLDTSCVALNEIQKTADEQPEAFAFDETSMYASFTYGAYPQEGYQAEPEEGYQPMYSGHDSAYYSTPSSDHQPTVNVRSSSEEPVIRRRRAPSIGVTSGRIGKRPSNKRAASCQHIKQEHIKQEHIDDNYVEVDSAARAFPCPLVIYGCTSSFSAKNEWKRHVQTQHLRLGYWRCGQCAQSERGDRKPNDFNRKDLFIQHVRRMHPIGKLSSTKKKSSSKTRSDGSDELYLQGEANNCYRHLRNAPDNSSCLFCDQHFSGHGSWEERMEHIGRHMENIKKGEQEAVDLPSWREDKEVEMWLLQARIIDYEGERLRLVDCPGRQVKTV